VKSSSSRLAKRSHTASMTWPPWAFGGCAFHQTPYLTYEGHHDFADTVVFASYTTVP
jgi:hypothetical protein